MPSTIERVKVISYLKSKPDNKDEYKFVERYTIEVDGEGDLVLIPFSLWKKAEKALNAPPPYPPP